MQKNAAGYGNRSERVVASLRILKVSSCLLLVATKSHHLRSRNEVHRACLCRSDSLGLLPVATEFHFDCLHPDPQQYIINVSIPHQLKNLTYAYLYFYLDILTENHFKKSSCAGL